MSSFFTLPTSQRKRKREDRDTAPASKKRGVVAADETRRKNGYRKKEKRWDRDESASISGSGSDEDGDITKSVRGESSDESLSLSDEGETAADRRRKLAERYLENIREEVEGTGFDAAEIDRDLIAERLKDDVDESKGRIFRQIASQLNFSGASHAFFRTDTQSTTSVAVHAPYIFTVSKDKTLVKWELMEPRSPSTSPVNGMNGVPKRTLPPMRKKPKRLRFIQGLQNVSGTEEKQGHSGSILTVAVSPSGKFVATGGADRKLIIWDAETLTPMKTFTHHRDAVSGLSFTRQIPKNSSGEQLFSGSFDRTIKTWSLSSTGHAYVETLFGHQDNVSSVASMTVDQCVSVGARDRTARLWKVIDETQLVFRGGSAKCAEYHENNLDCIAVVPPSHFVTGSDSGSLSLWSIHKKKPLYTIPLAHGFDPLPPLGELSSEVDKETAAQNSRFLRRTPRWITALTTVPGTDIILSGSWDGWIRAWRLSEDKKMIYPLGLVGGRLSSSASTPPLLQLQQPLASNGIPEPNSVVIDRSLPLGTQSIDDESILEPLLKGVVNDIAVYECRPEASKLGQQISASNTTSSTSKASKRKKGAHAEQCPGLYIVAALGKEHRFGRWKCFSSKNSSDGSVFKGRNGAVIFNVPFHSPSSTSIEHHLDVN